MTEIAVWPANSLPAIVPAIAGVGRCAKSMGTTKKPSVVKLPHHRAAAHNGRERSTLDVMHRHHFVGAFAARCLYHGGITNFFANQRAGDRGADVD